MNIKYFYEFKGLDGVLNRVEILTAKDTTTEEITAAGAGFILEYQNAEKLEPVQGSFGHINVLSKNIFQFLDLHTDDMLEYMVKIYRGEGLFWQGWLDSELYSEQLSDYPPYPVSFTCSDFNVWERLKFRDAEENKYNDIAPLLTQIKRCFDILSLTFGKIYIGCSTTSDEIIILDNETILHKTYVQSSNFYDEDNEPMTCRGVVESILRPFGLMLIQKDGNIYIYDYNTVAEGGRFKVYDALTLSYNGDEIVNIDHGEVLGIGTLTTQGGYGFEEMKNNVEIRSSIYAESLVGEGIVNNNNVSERIDFYSGRDYTKWSYAKCVGIENMLGRFDLYEASGEVKEGAVLVYAPNPIEPQVVYRIRIPTYMIDTDVAHFINIKMQAYISTNENPFIDDEIESDIDGVMKLYCNLYAVDENGTPIRYLDLIDTGRLFWKDATNGQIEQGRCVLWFSEQDVVGGSVLNKWLSNTGNRNPYPERLITIRHSSTGLYAPQNSTSGYLVFEVTNNSRIVNPEGDTHGGTTGLYPAANVSFILLNNISLIITDKDENPISADDVLFKSYINKKVKNDYPPITLNVISGNEDRIPIGRGNILVKEENTYKLCTSFNRAGQADILERLLMCTIHSNYSHKNEQFEADIKLTDNPMMRYIAYNPILSHNYLVKSCRLDLSNAIANIKAVGFSADTDRLSDIPYE